MGLRDADGKELNVSNMIKVHDREFPILFDGDGVEHVKLVDLCEPFGLDVSGQRARLKSTGWATPEKISGVRTSGKKAAFVCLPLDQVPMYFATLSPGHVDEAFRPSLIAMQREAARALSDYYRHGGAIRPDALPEQLRDLQVKIDEILRKEPLTDPVWPARFVKRYEAWRGRTWKKGDAQPFSMKAANWFFYEMIFPAPVLDVIRARGLAEGCRYHQIIADAPRDYLVRQLDFAAMLADDSGSEREWRARMRRVYHKSHAILAGQGELDL